MNLASFSDRQLLENWRGGDQRAADLLVSRYMVRLIALARSRLPNCLSPRTEPEDVVMSAWRSFFVATGRGLVMTSEDLWPILATFTTRKLFSHIARHHAESRDVTREIPFSDAYPQSTLTRDPDPQHAAALLDDLQTLMSSLDEQEQQILLLALHGHKQTEISQHLGCSERTIRRALARFRSLADQTPTTSQAPSLAPPPTKGESRPLPAFEFSDLQLLTMIGQGRFGKVYRALQHVDGSIVAVKFLKRAFWQNEVAVSALLREYTLVTAIDHPSVIRHYGWGRTPQGAIFLVMDWVDGPNLSTSYGSTRTVSEIVHCVKKIAEALVAIHDAGIVHGDLSPSNVLRHPDGRLILTDFGLARSHFEMPHLQGGTPAFLAPEQWSDAFGPISTATDVYGLGAILYHLLFGRPPFEGPLEHIVPQIISSKPIPIPQEANITPWLRDLLTRCLDKAPSQRPQPIRALLAELEQYHDA